MTRASLYLLVLLPLLALSGCIERHVSRSASGEYIDGRAFARIEPGKSSAAWAKSLMGQPNKIEKTDVGTEIWKWTYSENKRVEAQFFILNDHSSVTNQRSAVVEVKDGVVINKWFSDRDLVNEDRFN